MGDVKERILDRLKKVYPGKIEHDFENRLFGLLDRHQLDSRVQVWDETDSFLITYGDTLQKDGKSSLGVLHQFANAHLKDVISTIHILPFFPYSSDDGFSVVDFCKVNPELGRWEDVKELSADFNLMFDLVINHVSSKSEWFSQFLKNESPGKDFVLVPPADFDTSKVIRPRSSPLLTSYITSAGKKNVWTTFSADQIDLNYWNPELLLEMIRIFLFYVEKGASVIRLDAIAFLWKRSGTGSLHEKETHEIVKIFRDVVDYCCPHVVLLTETNVPHLENISYFGNSDEAQMVYQFPLPPLLLFTLNRGDASYLKQWLMSFVPPGKGMTFFNFTASHDGIGVRPLEGLIPDEEKIALAEDMKTFGGLVNTRRTPEGLDVPYELNITYFDALKGTQAGIDDLQVERFICSQTLMMSLQGVPAFYIHSLFGMPNYYKGVAETQQNRTINRRKLHIHELDSHLAEGTNQKKVFDALIERITLRRNYSAFHPDADQKLLQTENNVVAILRENMVTQETVLAVFNIGKTAAPFVLLDDYRADVIADRLYESDTITLQPYQCLWMKKTK